MTPVFVFLLHFNRFLAEFKEQTVIGPYLASRHKFLSNRCNVATQYFVYKGYYSKRYAVVSYWLHWKKISTFFHSQEPLAFMGNIDLLTIKWVKISQRCINALDIDICEINNRESNVLRCSIYMSKIFTLDLFILMELYPLFLIL